ncbi:hypothetical protein QQS21_005790 [Conoideocrella luteorostrata]|uniref:Uncharacterized protein n=1 Tax=Conoideocrella luteorostrata TaxID=1105319 RepID=A0AAJ0CNS2_9HYPO|nr:hypothetical protein QQS21_005790 [Conoideocrella luteorostrata]
MARITVVALLAFAMSTLALPQAPTGNNEPILDFQGNPLSKDKEAQFLKLEESAEQKEKQLVATFTKEQQEMDQDIQNKYSQLDAILGVPKNAKRQIRINSL